MRREETLNTLDDLFESALIQSSDIDNVVSDDIEDEVLGYLEENRKISIFDSEFILEGEE